MTKKVRLSYELSAVQHAIQGAQFLAMLLRDDGLPSPEYARATPAALAGILILAEERLTRLIHEVSRLRRPEAGFSALAVVVARESPCTRWVKGMVVPRIASEAGNPAPDMLRGSPS